MEDSSTPLTRGLSRINEILAKIRVPGFTAEGPDEINVLLDHLCDEYLEAPPEWRSAVREELGRHGDLLAYLFAYMGRAIRRLLDTADPVWVRRTLASLSMEDGRPDQRDSFTRANELWQAAVQVGLDPSQDFLEAARKSSREKTSAVSSTAWLLEGRVRFWENEKKG